MEVAEEETGVDFSGGDSLTVNWDEVEGASGEVMPRGMYPCTISECEFTHSESGGNPMWTLTLEISEGDYAGRKLYTHLVFKGAGLGFTKTALERIKPELLQQPLDPEDEEAMGSMLGTNLKAKVTVKKWEGENRNNVRGLYAAGGDDFV